MASIFETYPLEDGGGVARAGITYQDHVSVRLFLDMTRRPEMTAVWCETHDDQLIKYGDGENAEAEFVQVKSDAHNQLWSISLLTERHNRSKDDEGVGTSLVERQLSRDRGDEPLRFRVVTYRDVKSELELLKRPFAQRTEEECRALEARLIASLGDIRSNMGHGLDYWVRNAIWEVYESQDALIARNLRQLQSWGEESQGALIHFSGYERLYNGLVAFASELSVADGDPRVTRRINREGIIEWLNQHLAELPPARNVNHASEIAGLERESIARCEDLWIALGVSEDEAWLLANDFEFGKVPEKVLSRQSHPFSWFVADYGSGKTLTMERLFQQALLKLRMDPSSNVPVYLKAKQITRPLREEAETIARRVGYAGRKLFLILDAVDECGTERAYELLRDARTLSRTIGDACVFVTSIPLALVGFEEAQIPLKPLDGNDALALVKHFSRWPSVSLWHLPMEIQSAATSPLFATLFGLSQRNSFQQPRSTGELLDSLVKRALKPETVERLRPAVEVLTRLAILSTDNEGLPVPISEFSTSSFDIQPLLQSRLVKKVENHIDFSVSLIRCWFAAEGIRSSKVSIAEIISDPYRFERWRRPLSIYLSDCSFVDATSLLGQLAKTHPSRGALLIDEAFRDENYWNEECITGPEDFGDQIRRVFECWRIGFGPIATMVLPCRENGQLRGLKVYPHESSLTAVWLENPSAPDVEISPEPWKWEFMQNLDQGPYEAHMGLGGSQPAWVWQTTRKQLGDNLKKLLEKRSLLVDRGVIGHELAWLAACQRLNIAHYVPTEIRISDLFDMRRQLWNPRKHGNVLSVFIDQLVKDGIEVINAPYPQHDTEIRRQFGGYGFSIEQSTRRTEAVFRAAIQAYRDIVETWFSKFSDRFLLYNSFPIQIVGVVCGNVGQENRETYSFGYRLFSNIKESSNSIRFSPGASADFKELATLAIDSSSRSKPSPFFIGESFSHSVSTPIFHETPAVEIAYDWLEQDLKKVKWIN